MYHSNERIILSQRQKNTLIQSINAAMSIQLSVVLSCRLYVLFSHSHPFPTSLHYSLTDELLLSSVLNLRATRNRASAPRINKFSNTLGRWVADFAAEDSTDPNASIALSPRPPHDRSTASIPQKDDQPTVGNGASDIPSFLFLPSSFVLSALELLDPHGIPFFGR